MGICIGSVDSEVAMYSSEEVETDGKIFRARKVRVEQIGIAIDLSELADWKPACLYGKSLKDIIWPGSR
jgi:hypothetical protein